MKKLLLVLLFVSSTAFGSGKVSVQPNYWPHLNKVTPVVGLAIYEHISKGSVAYNSWTGLGDQPVLGKENVLWMTTKQEIEIYMGDLTVTPGIQINYIPETNDVLKNVHVKVSAKLW